MMTTTPKLAGLPDWCAISGMSRTATYDALGRRNLKAIKLGKRTLIDVDTGLEWIRSLPVAQIQTPQTA